MISLGGGCLLGGKKKRYVPAILFPKLTGVHNSFSLGEEGVRDRETRSLVLIDVLP